MKSTFLKENYTKYQILSRQRTKAWNYDLCSSQQGRIYLLSALNQTLHTLLHNILLRRLRNFLDPSVSAGYCNNNKPIILKTQQLKLKELSFWNRS